MMKTISVRRDDGYAAGEETLGRSPQLVQEKGDMAEIEV